MLSTIVTTSRRHAGSSEDAGPLEVASNPVREGVTIVIPTFNEELAVARAVKDLLGLLATAMDVDYEVILVDDGSSDGTAAAIEPLISGQVRLISHSRNRGYGAAIKTGVSEARYPWVLITDADGTYPAEHIPELLSHRDRFQMIVGARRAAQVSAIRRPPKWALRKLASYLSRQEIPDLNSGLRLMRRDVLQRFSNILPDQFSYTTTITLAMFSTGYNVKYIPIEYLKRDVGSKSKIRPFHDTIGFTKLIIRTMLYFDPLRIFVPISGAFMLVAVVVAVVSYLASGRVMDVTTVLLFTTGFQLLALGMIADMLNRRMP